MPAPFVTVDEQNVGARPVIAPNLNKIGLVGKFNWGPPNTPLLVGSLAQLKQAFGPTYEAGLDGLLTAHAIYAQNARAGVYVVRVAPSGVAAVKAAKTFSSKVTLTALYTGTEGNNIAVTIANGTTSGKKYTVTDSNLGITEVWDNQTNTSSTVNTFAAAGGPNEAGAGSKLVVFSYAGDGDPTNAAASNLSGGTNGTTADADYVGAVGGGGARTGLYCFDAINDVYWLLLAQQSSTTCQSGLQTYAESRSVKQGLVFGILNTAANLDPSSVSIGSLDTDRGAIFWPWVKSSAVPAIAQASYMAPGGFIAGLLSTQKPNRGPLNLPLQGITDLQYVPSDPQLDTLSDGRVNPIIAARGRGIRAWDQLTLSSDPAWTEIEIRREYDAIETAAWDSTAWVVGEPNIPDELWPHVAAQMDALLSAQQDQGTIVAYLPTVVDDTNNTPDDIAAGRLNIDLRVQFTYAAKFITIRIDRVLDASAA